MQDSAPAFFAAITRWSHQRRQLRGLLLVGSYARASARPDSDVDLVLLWDAPATYLADYAWVYSFGNPLQAPTLKDYGMVQSLRVFYESGLEVEFGLTSVRWATTDPLDPGTRQVVSDGAKILYDPDGLLATLLAHIHQAQG